MTHDGVTYAERVDRWQREGEVDLSRLWDGVAAVGLMASVEEFMDDDDVIRWWNLWREAMGIEPG